MATNSPPYRRATHLSMVWAITLAVLTIIEWRGLDRDPLGQPLMLPFIEREVTVTLDAQPLTREQFAEGRQEEQAQPRHEVEIRFNGPLFLLCFFGPVALFFGIGWAGKAVQDRAGG